MPYKYTGDYAYKKLVGDYRYAGDPGIFSFVGKALGTIGKTVAGFLPGPAGKVARLGVGALERVTGRRVTAKGIAKAGAGVGILGLGGAALAGLGREDGGPRRRRMNVLNVRALRRATRRLMGARKTFGKAMRGLGYTVVRSGGARRSGHGRGCKCVACR